ncbi:uncharacterized protein LOC123272998 [Cotesia glomerata]|uniref:Uncharacterized protein n=1 Tax=Cotesia glomerata TaxID=32391 RepID=A0AAV7J4G6_COTGL|nr:uncharacterized protein LOC123272998 [Cotesia glomerata]KAH0564175.1 hypothetical protein KQX54_009976 [Cotesia glomerata]
MKFFVASILLMALIAVAMGKPTEVESLEPVKTESASHQEAVPVAEAVRDKRGIILGAYTAPVAYTAAYTAPVAYTSAYSYPYAYSAYSAYPYYAAAYSSPYYLA